MGPGPHAEKGSLCSHDAAAHHRQLRPVTILGHPRSNPGSAPAYQPKIWEQECIQSKANRLLWDRNPYTFDLILEWPWPPKSSKSLADLHTKFSGSRPLRDPILSFSHTFSPKSTRVRGPCPPKRVHAPHEKSWIRPSKSSWPWDDLDLNDYITGTWDTDMVSQVESFTCYC